MREQCISKGYGLGLSNIESTKENTLAHLEKIYIYITGSNKGFSSFANDVKESQPEARKIHGGSVRWELNTEKVWDKIMEDTILSKIVIARKIEDFEELSYRAFEYYLTLRL